LFTQIFFIYFVLFPLSTGEFWVSIRRWWLSLLTRSSSKMPLIPSSNMSFGKLHWNSLGV